MVTTSVMSHAQGRCTHATLVRPLCFLETPSGRIQDSSDKALSSVGGKVHKCGTTEEPFELRTDALYYHQAPVCMHPCARGYINKQL